MSGAQLGFDALLDSADEVNRKRSFERETGHLPAALEDALPFHRGLIERHHGGQHRGIALGVNRVEQINIAARVIPSKSHS
jgi:hypothetical protein